MTQTRLTQTRAHADEGSGKQGLRQTRAQAYDGSGKRELKNTLSSVSESGVGFGGGGACDSASPAEVVRTEARQSSEDAPVQKVTLSSGLVPSLAPVPQPEAPVVLPVADKCETLSAWYAQGGEASARS